MALLLPKVLERVHERPLMIAGGALMTMSLFLGLFTPGFVGLTGLWFPRGAGASLVMTPTGRLLKQSCHLEDRSALSAASSRCRLAAGLPVGRLGGGRSGGAKWG